MPSSPTVTARPSNVTPVVLIAASLIVAQLVVRGWLALTGSFYWDDLILIGRASTQPILSWEFLGHSHDGHFMPAAFLVAGISTLIAPVQWLLPALTLIVGQALASLAVWRMIRTIVPAGSPGTRDLAALAALAFYLFTPMTVPGFVWWAAGLNTLPLQAAMAWIVADAIILTRGSDARHGRLIVIRSTVIFVIALAFFEKSLLILPVAFVAAVLAARFVSDSRPVRAPSDPADAAAPVAQLGALGRAFVGARALWCSLGVIFVAWALLFFSVSDATAGVHSVSQTAQLVWRSINRGVVPALVGGPWEWERWIPSPPMGFASGWMIGAGWLVLAAVVGWAVRSRRGAVAVAVSAAAYVVLAQVPVMWNRSSANTALELAQTMRYLPDAALVLTLAAALVIAAPSRVRDAGHAQTQSMTVPALAATLLAALIGASAMISTASYQSSWTDDPTADYLANAKKSLASAQHTTMFDQALPLEVLLPVAYPYNQISATFGRVSARPDFGSVTDRLVVLDTAGNLTPGAVTPARTFTAGAGTCADPETTAPVRRALDGPLIQWRWTIALTYCATSAGTVEISLTDSDPVRAPVSAGLHVLYVQLEGRGDAVEIRPITAGLALHTGDGRVGEVVDASLLGQ